MEVKLLFKAQKKLFFVLLYPVVKAHACSFSPFFRLDKVLSVLGWPEEVQDLPFINQKTLCISASYSSVLVSERERHEDGEERCVCVCVRGGEGGGEEGGIGRKWGLFVLCYLADISSMCRLASWQAETTGALGMLSVQEISFILINAAPNPPPAILLES